MEEFWKRFDVIAAKLGEAAPVVYERLLVYQQAKSIGYLAIGAVCCITAALIGVAASRLFKKACDDSTNYGPSEAYGGVAIVLGVITLAFGVGACINLFDVWNWVGAFAPDARLVHEVWQAATQGVGS